MTERSTSSGIVIQPLYEPADGSEAPRPGTYPYTRGIHETMYRGRLWTMRQYAGFGSAREANARYKFLLESGTTGLSVAFDLPTQMGRDSDHPSAKGEVGRVGVAISSLEDMEILLEGIPLDQVSISMTINATASILLAYLLCVAERRGTPWTVLRGTVQNDILKEYIARGTYIYPPAPAMRIVTDMIEFCKDAVPQWNTISISGYHIREAGSTAVQEIAFTLADGIEYVRSAVQRGLAIDDFAPRLAFFFNCHNNFLEEVAKFRAARQLWAKIMKDRFCATDPRSMMLRFHTQTAGSSLTAQQPLNNVVRTTLQALAAVLGGTQSLHTNGYDEALGLPTEESALLALRTQQIIAHESGVVDAADPLGGSYLIESLTRTLAARAEEEINRIEQIGGMVRAIEARYPQTEIERAAYDAQVAVESGAATVVGVNAFTAQENGDTPVLKVDPAIERDQVERLQRYRSGRDEGQTKHALSAVSTGSVSGANVMPLICDAVRAGATTGEISDAMRTVFGEYRE